MGTSTSSRVDVNVRSGDVHDFGDVVDGRRGIVDTLPEDVEGLRAEVNEAVDRLA